MPIIYNKKIFFLFCYKKDCVDHLKSNKVLVVTEAFLRIDFFYYLPLIILPFLPVHYLIVTPK